MADRGVHVHAVKQGGEIGNGLNGKVITFAYALAAEIERDLLGQRVKEGLARAAAAGKRLGRPRVTVHKSKLDVHAALIQEYAGRGVSKSNLARVFSCNPSTMTDWLKRHELHIVRRPR